MRTISTHQSPLDQADFFRLDVARGVQAEQRATLGQFFTPMATARLMASMFRVTAPSLRLLDAGAGTGTLSAAWIDRICSLKEKPKSVSITAYEIEPAFLDYLKTTLKACQVQCAQAGIRMTWDVQPTDFIRAGADMIRNSLFTARDERFNGAILNPPYRKIRSDSDTRRWLRTIGVETSNLYTGFLSIVTELLEPEGELVAITPRSFCNGPYFKPFRNHFLQKMALQRIHLFETRNNTFKDDKVLQENIIVHAIKGTAPPAKVYVSSSMGSDDTHQTMRKVAFDHVIRPNDPDKFIHIVPDELGTHVTDRLKTFQTTLHEVGIEVSTGRVVDFRAESSLRSQPTQGTVPLIYPGHLSRGFVKWPKGNTRKPNAIVDTPQTGHLLVPQGTYVLVKRFSAKEEKRRIVAALYDPNRIGVRVSRVGFENHLNYYHDRGRGLNKHLAKGLVAYLNSTLVDLFFRQFSGHTQVNATDLRRLPYPPQERLESLGRRITRRFPDQYELDRLVEDELPPPDGDGDPPNPVQTKERIDEARAVLKDLGLPRGQQNDRSALVLLALLDLRSETPWSQARAPLLGITPIMEFIAKHYGKHYAPNTRETVRRQTVHQFVDAGLICDNPDNPSRPVNSPKAVYQIAPGALQLLRSYGSTDWNRNLRKYLTEVETLQRRYARERTMHLIPVQLPRDKRILLSPGGQNILIKEILEQFCPRFTPGAKVLYVGDAKQKWAYVDPDGLRDFGIELGSHGKMPDVAVFHTAKRWLVLIEAVTSHGPVDPKRRDELQRLFKKSKTGLVFVTAFPDRRAMVKYLNDISWETEVWVAESPDHMIHFNGERFLGP